jgi:hypothetical protein
MNGRSYNFVQKPMWDDTIWEIWTQLNNIKMYFRKTGCEIVEYSQMVQASD